MNFPRTVYCVVEKLREITPSYKRKHPVFSTISFAVLTKRKWELIPFFIKRNLVELSPCTTFLSSIRKNWSDTFDWLFLLTVVFSSAEMNFFQTDSVWEFDGLLNTKLYTTRIPYICRLIYFPQSNQQLLLWDIICWSIMSSTGKGVFHRIMKEHNQIIQSEFSFLVK